MKKEPHGKRIMIGHKHSSTLFVPVLLVVFGLVLSSCSSINSNLYVKQQALLKSNQTIAVLPLAIRGVSYTSVVTSYGASWISETQSTAVSTISPGEYEPAVDRLLRKLDKIFKPAALISPSEVNKAMAGKRFSTVEESIPELAKTLNVDIVVVCWIREFNQKPPGYEKANASGHMDLTLYSRQGDVICSLASDAQVVAATTLSPTPSLTDFVEYAMNDFANKVEVTSN